VDPVRPQIHIIHSRQITFTDARCSAFHCSVSFVITGPDKPFDEPRNSPERAKSPDERPCR
jgi:hypothetical protein